MTQVNSAELGDELESHRRELLAHCYRMLGSADEAEDLVQEVLLRAWRSHAGFEGRSSLRVWLYRIATNACLTALQQQGRRALPSGLGGPASDPAARPGPVDPLVAWVEPIADDRVVPESSDPAAVVAARETLRLALIASLQYLPPRQRAVLLLRDVLGFPASEVAEMLGISAVAVKSALQRARVRLNEASPTPGRVIEPTDPWAKEQLSLYIAGFENADISALEKALRADASIEMVGTSLWFAGRSTCLRYLASVIGAPGHYLMTPTLANGQPAAAAYARVADGSYQAFGLGVLTVTPTGVSRITVFGGGPRLVASFGLPGTRRLRRLVLFARDTFGPAPGLHVRKLSSLGRTWRTMKFSIFLPSGFVQEFQGFNDPVDAYERIVAIAKTADDAGYEALVCPDHLTTIPPSHAPLFDAWTLMTGLASETSRVRLGQLVMANSYRNPALMAKMASTLDVISRGRLTFGIGSGWWEPDYIQYGYEFGTAGQRLDRLGEAVQIIRALWTEKETTFEGTHYQVHGAVNEPKGVQRPHIPLLIAGGGEKKTLRLVARYGDACNIMDSPEVASQKFAVLRQHCADAGRDYETIHRTVTTALIIADTDAEARALVPPGASFAYPGDLGSYGLIGTVDTVKQRIAAFEDAGVQELIIGFQDPTSVEQVTRFAELFG